jgi:hypothetical protein
MRLLTQIPLRHTSFFVWQINEVKRINDLWNFVDINKHPMAPCDLHRLLDRKFSASTFARDVRPNFAVYS